MKRLVTIFTLFIGILSGNAQSQKVRFGITTGATVANYKVTVSSVSVTSKSKPGITLGVFSDIPLGSAGSFMPALNFVQKGGTLKAEGEKNRLTTNHFEVPLNFVYNAKLSNGKIFLGAGPSFNVGISGKSKWESAGMSGSDKVKFGKDEDFKRVETALNVVTGYVGKSGIMVALNYNAGLSNMVAPDETDGKFYNRYFGLRLGFVL
ncbi:MAG: PorT family protein [Chitinophagaceae bacterium]|nr:PorT family protein [Chitinophagaceae bacterium]